MVALHSSVIVRLKLTQMLLTRAIEIGAGLLVLKEMTRTEAASKDLPI